MSWMELAERSNNPTVVSALEAFRENPAAIHMLKMVSKVALTNQYSESHWWEPIIPELVGQTLTKIENLDNEEIILVTSDGQKYKFYHDQDCCECVMIEDIIGDLDDLIGSPLVRAEERTREAEKDEVTESGTWSFYEFATIKGSVTIRWLGSSNGYYSESVNFRKIED